ncbi:DUF4348 domain-containing protein [Allomuricauda sp. F6463D]|uniref:DUF4348 domain-containing protein n=1 Tax=Allomuricauda sp. F6463D TaxID=2926409 RepID=UPI001FF2A5C2|nr:DUF4348 domain-containing protein [Muricauda sp. F6463D]MCK0160010.1 DUF4348 domain-containing protein [Muricauda sp. F6463D]
MRKITFIFYIIGLSNCFGQTEKFESESDIESYLNQRKVNLSEPITLKSGILTTKNILMGFDGKPAHISEIRIELKGVEGIETEFYEKTNITALKFTSNKNNSIQEKQMNSEGFFKRKSSEINLRFVKKETLSELLDFFNNYKSDPNFTNNEKFDSFIYKFCLNEEFQLDRVKFPLKLSYRKDFENYNAALFDTIISKKSWKHDDLYYDQVARFQTYDNHQKELRDTDERVVHYKGIENGRDLAYFFERIKGLWYLTAIENKTD